MAIKQIQITKDNTLRELSISYEILNNNQNKDIVFLHGWGSNKELMRDSFKHIANNYRHIYIDLPGFGKSPNDKYIIYTQAYAQIIDSFLHSIDAKKDVIIGHSFGGKVAVLLNPQKLILLSSAGIIVPKSLSTKFKIGIFRTFKAIGFGQLYALFASKDANQMPRHMYDTFKRVVNEDFSNEFKSYNQKALILWGEDDKDTPLQSGKQIALLIKNSQLHILKGEHYFFIYDKISTKKLIEEFLNEH